MELVDRLGRIHRDLRISVTDRCNFRCSYCLPTEGIEWTERSEILTFDEIVRLATLLVAECGVSSIRLTGGEPTVRNHLPRLVARLSKLDVDLSLTTNGSNLSRMAEQLADAGLDRINISLDSLDPLRFAEMTKRDCLSDVLAGIDAAVLAKLGTVKVNAVLVRGHNDDEVVDFLRFGIERKIVVRFIEFMPLDAQEEWTEDSVVTRSEILEKASAEFEILPSTDHRGSSPAEEFRYKFADSAYSEVGRFGVIGSVTEPFCGDCDRIRLTADGQFRNCLFARSFVDMKDLMRSGATDKQLLEAMSLEVDAKAPSHGIGQVHFLRPSKAMSQIGG